MTILTEQPPIAKHPGLGMLSATRMNYRVSVRDQLWNLRDITRLMPPEQVTDTRRAAWNHYDAWMHAMIREQAWFDAAASWAVCVADAIAEGRDPSLAMEAYSACRARAAHWTRRATELKPVAL